jgi:hypothetical protein
MPCGHGEELIAQPNVCWIIVCARVPDSRQSEIRHFERQVMDFQLRSEAGEKPAR